MNLIEKQRAAVAEHIRLENEHDWAAVPRTLVQDDRAFYDFVSVGFFKGADGVRAFYESVAKSFPDLHIEIQAEYDVPGCSIREGFLSGTHHGDYLGIAATGRAVRVPIAGFFVFDQATGELLGERLYMDQGSALRQLQGA
ncbi:MAG: hypothetical protein NVS9B4_12760 [Candidatus Acidiferrum sp.]